MWREGDLLDPSCGVFTDTRSWWMRGRERAELRGREDSGMTIRFWGKETSYFFCCNFTWRRTFWGYPAWEFSAGTSKPSIPGANVDLCIFSREKIHVSHLFLERENPTLLNCQQRKGWVWPRPNSPHLTSFHKQGIWSSELFAQSHTPSGPRQSLRSPDASARVFSTVWADSRHRGAEVWTSSDSSPPILNWQKVLAA